MATLPDRPTLDYLQREDVLYQASGRAFRLEAIAPVMLSIAAGMALTGNIQRGSWHVWRDAIAAVALVVPLLITGGVIWLAMNPGMQRWTTEAVTSAARRAYEALLQPLETAGKEPPAASPFHSPHVAAVQALEDFAIALERYALQRALPDGRNPMPRVVARLSAAAALVRDLRDGVELDRIDGGKRALLEVERLLKVLASGRLQDLAPGDVPADGLLRCHWERRVWRQQALRGAAFTLCLAGVVFALASSAMGVALATVAAAGIVATWDKILRFSTGSDPHRSVGT
ncbi:hypothetical protein AB0G73_15095 [Streptomyces sp. NPDC020719]|uniref:hypothetical protein n=1 Tax=Streptomyces sp. NPDC020719 TaxID=3154896 RepID=UPI0033CCF7B4